MKVHIIDYGSGNLLSVRRAFLHCGADVTISERLEDIAKAERLVLPGVGAFGDCMRALEGRNLLDEVLTFAHTQRPFLGICVGMQALLETGEEFGEHTGLGIIPGRVSAIPSSDLYGQPHKIPHIGWSPLLPPDSTTDEIWSKTVLDGVSPGETVYFVHSYTAVPLTEKYRLADSEYNGRLISAAIKKDNVVGLQFHPEKSGPLGLKILHNFLRI